MTINDFCIFLWFLRVFKVKDDHKLWMVFLGLYLKLWYCLTDICLDIFLKSWNCGIVNYDCSNMVQGQFHEIWPSRTNNIMSHVTHVTKWENLMHRFSRKYFSFVWHLPFPIIQNFVPDFVFEILFSRIFRKFLPVGMAVFRIGGMTIFGSATFGSRSWADAIGIGEISSG